MAHEGDARANITLRVPLRSRPLIVLIKRRKKSPDNTAEFQEEDSGLGSDDSVQAPPAEVRVNKTAVANATVGDADALSCGVCFRALRPPIFQCEAGHVVCSVCRDKLEATGNGRCHVCRVATRGGYRRCHAMERLVDCIRVPCHYSAHGCDATPPYHAWESHRQVCPHAPCHCPGDGDSCGFVGSTSALLDHFAGAHDWPCTTKARAGETLRIRLRVGFNFFLLTDYDRGNGEQAAATCSVPCLLFLLNVTQKRQGRAISVLGIHPHANGVAQPLSMICRLAFVHSGDQSLCRMHCQSSEFKVVCTDLSNGLPSPDGCFQFIVPNAVLGLGDGNKDYVEVKVRISIN